MRTSKKERLARLSYRKDVAESILQGRKLSDVHPLDLLGLKDDWSPISGCTGPSLSEWKKPKQKKKDELVAFRRSLGKRYSHLAAACKDDNDRLLLLNNAKIYLESEAEFRLRFWLTVGGHDKDATTRWPHCNNPKCSNTAQTAEGPDGCKITMESVWDSGTPDAKGKASAENAISISSDSSSQSGSDSESTASGPLLACMCGESRKTIRLLFKHGRQCERVSDSARARCISVDRDKCLYGCAIKATNATRSDHEKRRHYICQGCGAITTKRQAHKFASLKHINPVDFFLRPEKDFEKRNPYQVIKEALMSIPPCEAEGVAKLNDAQLVSVIRSALEQWAALVITSQESPGSMNEGLGSQQDAPVTGPDPENETENSDNLVRLLESNTPASPVPQDPLISADSPTVAQSDCIISGPVEIVDRAQASSPVECPSPSFALLVNLHSAPALPPEDGTSQPLYSRNDGLSNGSSTPPHQARPDTTSNVEPIPSSAAARTTTGHSPTTEIDKRRPGQDVTENNGGAVPISKNSASVSSRQQEPLSAVDCPPPIETFLEHAEGGRSTSIENLSTASPSPATSLSGYDIDGRVSTGVDMPFSQTPSAIDSGVESAGTDNSITASQVSFVSTSRGTTKSRKRSIGNEDTESSGTQGMLLDPGNDTENWNNAERLLENNAPVSRLQQGSRISPDSPAADHSECAIFEPMEIVDQPRATSPVQLPSPSFSLPGDGQVSRRSAAALPPEDDIQDPSFDLCTCEDERPQPLHSSNGSLSNGSGAPPHQARPDTTSNVEPIPSSAAARTTTGHSPTTEIDKRRPGQDVTEDNGGAVPISKNSASVSSRQQEPLSAVDCPPPIETFLEHAEGGRSTSIENLSTASSSPATSLSGYDIDGTAPTGVDMPFSRKLSAIDSGVESAGTDNSITASQVYLVSTSRGTTTSRKRSIGNEDTESSGTQAKKPRLGQGSPADGHTSVMCVTQRDKVGNGTIIAPSLGSSDHRHALESDIARALEIEADCPTDYTSSEDTEQAGAYTTRGTEVSTAGPSTTIPLAYHTEPPSRHQLSTDATTFSQYMYTTAQEVNFVCQYEDMSPFLPVLTATAGHASDLVDGGQEISVFGNSQCVSKDDAPTNHNVPEDIDAEIKRICRLNNLEPSVTGTYSDNTIIWLIDSQKGLSELAKSPKYKYEEAMFVKATGYSCLTFYPKDISKLIDCAKDVVQDVPYNVPPGRLCSINSKQGLSHIGTSSCTFKEKATLVIWANGNKFLTVILDDEEGGGLPGLSKSEWLEQKPSKKPPLVAA